MLDLFLEEYDRLLGSFRRKVRRPEDAQDLVQEVCIRLLGVGQGARIENPRAYLWTVAHSVWCHYLGRGREANAADIDDPSVEPLLAEEQGYEQAIDTGVRVERLNEVLPELPAKCQAVMLLRWQHGNSYAEIAEQMGFSTENVKKYLKKGLLHCRRRMQELQ